METTITNALRVAALQYAIDAITSAGMPRLVEAFERQAREANALADRIESSSLHCVVCDTP